VSGAGAAAGLGDRRFRLRSDVTVLLDEEGAVVRGPATSLELKSRSIGEAISWLWPRLDGSRPLEAVTAELPAGTRGAIAALVARLHGGGMLLDLVEEDSPRLASLAELYPEQVSFLAHRSATPLAAFDRFRGARIDVRGEGVAIRNVAAALADYGALAVSFEPPASDSALERLVAAANARDPERAFGIRPGGGQGPGDSAPDVLIDAATDPAWAFATRLCDGGAQAPRLAGIYRFGERLAVLLHLGREAEATCFRGFVAAAAGQAGPGVEPIAPAAAAIAAHHCVAALFSELTGIATQAPPALLEIDQDRLTSRVRRLGTDPGCPRHGGVPNRVPIPAEALAPSGAGFPRPDVPDPLAATRETYDAIHRASAALVAPVGGPFIDLGEADLAQVPFARSAVSVRVSNGSAAAGDRLVCAALSAREARNQVMLAATERWAGATLRGAEAGEASFGAGWSVAEAAFRALAGLAKGEAPAGETRRHSPDEVAGHGPTAAHLVEMAVELGWQAPEQELRLARGPHGGWLAWCADGPAGPAALGATPGQALCNGLFRALVARALGDTRPATLVCGSTAEDFRKLLAEASRRVEFVEIASPTLAPGTVEGAALRLVEATWRLE
jgi:hypothetical protein